MLVGMKRFLHRCLNPPSKDISEEESSNEYESVTDSYYKETTATNATSTAQSSSSKSSLKSNPNSSLNSKSKHSINSDHQDTRNSTSRNCLNYCANPKPKDNNCVKRHVSQRRSIDSVNQLNRKIEFNTNPNTNGIQFNREGRKGSEGFQPNAVSNAAAYVLADYVQIAPLPEFHGSEDENPDTHIARFLRACRVNNAIIPAAWMLLFPITLQGKAAMWYDTQIEGNVLEWAELRKAFIEAFRSPQHTERLRQQLMKFRQESHETVRAYSERLQRILSKWPDHGIPDTILKGIYMDGFNEDGQDWLILQQPSSLKEAVKLSLHWEEAQNAKVGRKKERNNLALENKGEICNNNLQVYVERCEECEGKGHRMEECPNFLRKKTKMDQMNTIGWFVSLPGAIFLKRHLNKLRNWINSETGN